MSLTSTAWVKPSAPRFNHRLRLFCLPYAGGGAGIFHAWPKKLASTIDVCPIFLPGRERRLSEPAYTQAQPLAQAIVEAITPWLDLPYVVFGHSMGALLSFEVARELRRRPTPQPAWLFVAGHRAPHLPLPSSPVHQLPDAEFTAALRRLNGTPEELLQHAEIMELMHPTLRADFALCETYVHLPEAPLTCPISALGGLQDREVSREQLAAWRVHTQAVFSLRMCPGDHFFVNSAQDLVLQALTRDLAQIVNQPH